MKWNYRVIDLTASSERGFWLEIKEVYYDGEKPAFIADATIGGGDAGEIKDTLERMIKACSQPVLKADADGNLTEIAPMKVFVPLGELK
jgi:hypothetical protein